ncbi:histone deacetylase family protein [Sphingomonas sp. LB-2]|uniref:histone deacetylase family protein n=1 Tax=Sphingomonas caeni TaxID=2984949 RepID=UPI00223007BF|nr:histone deacetylase family protein [Sphingomonas caeni]MCW3846843.1 histone deacetylase family protein [Sphingomonas caeni]
MRGFFDPRQLKHAPRQELHNGAFVAHADVPLRAESVAAALPGLEPPGDHGEAPILGVHDAGYVDFLKNGARLWAEAGRPGEAIGYVFPVVGRRPIALSRIDALVGRYSYDAGTPLTPDAWEASYWSAQCALSALDAVLAGDRNAFALARPPGHHAGRDYMGGYCYLNYAAVTAQAARDAGVERVAILDIDYHHGNGTQHIFWERGDVFYASIHADPATDYPFYWGHADEAGEGEGAGKTLNLPLAQGADLGVYRAAQTRALDAIAGFDPGLIVVSFGADTFVDDPISRFRLETPDYAVLGTDIAARGWPGVIVMEGGYAGEALGRNVASFLSGFA